MLIVQLVIQPCHYFLSYIGLLSKSRGQVLRIAAVLHMLFKLEVYDKEKNTESEGDKDVGSAIEEEQQSIDEGIKISDSFYGW